MNYAQFKIQLKKLIVQAFTLSEIRTELCYELEIEFEEISPEGSGKEKSVVNLIEYCERRDDVQRLVDKCQEKRPKRSWPQIPTDEDENIEQTPPKLVNIPSNIIDTASLESEALEYQVEKNLLSEELRRIAFSVPPSSQEKINILTEELKQAEQGKDHEAVAKLSTELAELLTQEHRYVRARDFARKSASNFLIINRKEDAIKQHLFAAEIWMNHTPFAITLADYDLEKAEKIASEIKNFTLSARVFLLQAQYSILRGARHSVEKRWEQAESLLSKILPDEQVGLSTELAIQKAMVARIEEEWEKVKNLLEDANSRDWSPNSTTKRLELLWCLLFYYSEIGAWQDADRIYEAAKELLADQDESQIPRWLMHYAASLARRNNINGAQEAYLEALDFFKSKEATPSQKHHFFQDMLYSLAQHAEHEAFSSAMEHDSERLDLALNALHEDIGHLHRESARRNYFEGNTELAFIHANYSFMYAWRRGDWSGLSEAKKVLASLFYGEQEYTSATFVAIGAAQNKVIEKYALNLNDLTDSDEIRQLVDNLLLVSRTRADLEDALVALSRCVDIVPTDKLDRVIQVAVDTLDRYLVTDLATSTCRTAIQILRFLAPRFNQTHTQEIIRFCINILKQQLHWTMEHEFIQLLGACFDNSSRIQPELYSPAMEVVLAYHDLDAPLKTEAETALLYIASNAPSPVRKRISTFLRDHSKWDYLAILKEPIPEETVWLHIEGILKAITPRRKNGGISYSGRLARSINMFNQYMTPSLGHFVVAGLLNAIRNPEGFLANKSDSILALRWLPEDTLSEQANEISQLLLEVAEGKYTNTEVNDFLKWFGNEEEIRRNSLYTLGRLYSLVNNSLKKQIHDKIFVLSCNSSPTIRMGAAMALRTLEGSYTFSSELGFSLIELLQDEDPKVRHWAASAAGHRIADRKILKSASRFIIQRLLKAATEESNAHARAGVGYSLRILLESDCLDKPLAYQVQQARNRLVEDVNYQVRSLATG